MSWAERTDLYAQIEAHRKRPLIVYVTSKRQGAETHMASDALPHIIKQLDALPGDSRDLDFLIASNGGDPMVAWRIMTLIRQRLEDEAGSKQPPKVAVMIPQSAYSAATLVALGADEIIMHPNGHLGPVDMQIITSGASGQARRFSTEDISAFLDFVRDNLKITDQAHIRALFQITCKEVGSLGIGFTARSSKLAVDLGERLLGMHMKDDDIGSKLRSIVETLSRKFQSHAYPVNRKEALELGLPVNKKRDRKLEDLMWGIWLNIEEDLKENSPFDPLLEVLNSAEAPKLLAPVPQFDIAFCASAIANYNATIDNVLQATQHQVNPVDFEHTNALVESSRIAFANVTKGKILSCRTPDMMINSNRIVTSLAWEESQKA